MVYSKKVRAKMKTIRRRKTMHKIVHIRGGMETMEKKKSNEESFEPLSQTIISKKEWIKIDSDHIIINYKNSNYCMKRSYFNKNEIFPFAFLQSCILDKKSTVEDDFFIDFSKLGIEYSGVMNINDLEFFTNENENTFNIVNTSDKINTISSLIVNNHDIKQAHLHDLNLQFNDDERQYIYNYTFEHSDSINKYLWGTLKKEEEEIFDVKNHINQIDNIIYKYGTISSKPVELYRGVENKIKFGLCLTFLSTSTSLTVAKRFSGDNCCVFHLTLSPGIPFLSLEGVSYSKGREYEILLPRGLMINLTKEYQLSKKIIKFIDGKVQYKDGKRETVEIFQTHYECTVDMVSLNQFKSFKCYQHDILIHELHQ